MTPMYNAQAKLMCAANDISVALSNLDDGYPNFAIMSVKEAMEDLEKAIELIKQVEADKIAEDLARAASRPGEVEDGQQ